MSPNQMNNMLEGKGFEVELDGMSFIVSLRNCKPNAMMLEVELNDNQWKVSHHSKSSVKVEQR